MATKKKKPIASEFSTVDVAVETSGAVQPDEKLSESDKLQAKAGTVELSISDEVKQKLDAAEKLADENANYAKTVAQLQERIAEYIQEISDLKSKSAELVSDRIEELKAENMKLKAELNILKAKANESDG